MTRTLSSLRALLPLVLLAWVGSGCVHYHDAHHAHTYERPWHQHGHRYHHHGVLLVFDASLDCYRVDGHLHHYFRSNHYYRYHDGRWERAAWLRGPWRSIEVGVLPAGLRRHHGAGHFRPERATAHAAVHSPRAAKAAHRPDPRRQAARQHREQRREAAREPREAARQHREVAREHRAVARGQREVAREQHQVTGERRKVAKGRREGPKAQRRSASASGKSGEKRKVATKEDGAKPGRGEHPTERGSRGLRLVSQRQLP